MLKTIIHWFPVKTEKSGSQSLVIALNIFRSFTTNTCGLDPSVPHLKMDDNIHGREIILCMVYS